MPRPASRAIRLSTAPARLVALFALLAFFFQSLAVQTHIHHPARPGSAITQAANIPAPAPLRSQDPDDPANCRLCQELAHAGAYLIPAPAPLPAFFTIIAAAPALLAASIWMAMPGFAWQSRAPPLH